MIKIGSTEASKIYVGNTEITSAYLGSVKVYGASQSVTKTIVYTNGVVKIDEETITQNNKFINGSNKWATQVTSSAQATSVNIPVSNGDIVKITASARQAIYALLKSDTAVGTTPDFCSGYSSRISVNASQVANLTIPSDCNYLYVFVKTAYQEVFFPTSVKITTSNNT